MIFSDCWILVIDSLTDRQIFGILESLLRLKMTEDGYFEPIVIFKYPSKSTYSGFITKVGGIKSYSLSQTAPGGPLLWRNLHPSRLQQAGAPEHRGEAPGCEDKRRWRPCPGL